MFGLSPLVVMLIGIALLVVFMLLALKFFERQAEKRRELVRQADKEAAAFAEKQFAAVNQKLTATAPRKTVTPIRRSNPKTVPIRRRRRSSVSARTNAGNTNGDFIGQTGMHSEPTITSAFESSSCSSSSSSSSSSPSNSDSCD